MNEQLKTVAFCPHCGNEAPQVYAFSHSLQPTENIRHAYRPATYIMTLCETCQKPTLYYAPGREIQGSLFRTLAGQGFTLDEYRVVWPRTGELHDCVPETVQKRYKEAVSVKNKAPNLFANGIRRSLEALCKDRKATNKVLAQNLKELADRGEIPQTLAEMSQVLRYVGNIGSHDAEEDVLPEFVEAIDEFFRAIVEYVYVARHRVDEFQARLKQAQTASMP